MPEIELTSQKHLEYTLDGGREGGDARQDEGTKSNLSRDMLFRRKRAKKRVEEDREALCPHDRLRFVIFVVDSIVLIIFFFFRVSRMSLACDHPLHDHLFLLFPCHVLLLDH